MMLRAGVAAVALILAAGWPERAFAHAFGGRYDLPLPLDFFLVAAGLVVALSFVVMALFVRSQPRNSGGYTRRPVSLSRLSNVTGAVSALLLALLLATAFAGTERVLGNLAPTFVWVIFWVGVAFVVVFAGEIWPLINPWRAIGTWFGLRGKRMLPHAVGRWPAVAMFFGFAWLELVSGVGEHPRVLGWLILGYSAFLLLGMWAFGVRAWLCAADIFENVFGLFGRFGVLATRWDSSGRMLGYLRLPATGWQLPQRPHFSHTVFVIVLLATVSFDGLLETPAWAALVDWIETSAAWRPVLLFAQGSGWNLLAFVKTLALLTVPLLLMSAYLVCILVMHLAGGACVPRMRLINAFALSIVPIAIAYHLAHYLSYLLIAGQQLIPLASDPFGWGWNLFGTQRYLLDISVISPKFVWWFSAIAIVTGHVVSIAIGHLQGLAIYRNARHASASQVPLALLMVGYTMLSLWILSQPIVEAG